MSGNVFVTILERLIDIHGASESALMDNDTEMTGNTVTD
jgi:hypothetical protein